MSSLIAVATCIAIRHVIFISNHAVKHIHTVYFILLTLGDSDATIIALLNLEQC
jgi:hypothetical protein